MDKPARFTRKERKSQILHQINIHSRISFSVLANLLNVSEDTIRRDLNDLAEEKKIMLIKGGAMSISYHRAYGVVPAFAEKKKSVIAQKVVPLLKQGMIILIGGGTTIRELLHIMDRDLKCTFITVNPRTAVDLLDLPNAEVILLGGMLSKFSQMTTGGETVQQISTIHADLCIMGTNAIHHTAGLTDSDYETVVVKKAMIKAAKKLMVVTISEKLNCLMNYVICQPEAINYLITELPSSDPKLDPFRNQETLII